MATPEHAPRVAVLARAGEACDRLSGALREAGAEVVLVADPAASDPAEVRSAAPQAILVALDAGVGDEIERYEDVLADPAFMVIFEEAEQALQRTGWDAARWLRHLAAKLHRHGDVLPPGAEREEDLHPMPGRPQSASFAIDFEQAIAAFADEAQQHAGEVPVDSVLDTLSTPPLVEGTMLPPAETDVVATQAAGAGPDDAIDTVVVDAAFELVDFAPAADMSIDAPDHVPDAAAFDAPAFDPALELAVGDLSLADDLPIAVETPAPRFAVDEPPMGIEEFLAARIAETPRGTEEVESTAVEESQDAPGGLDLDLGSLSLVADDAPMATPAAPPRAESTWNLDALGSGLSLADPDSYGHGPLRGAVLIEAGLGGPDAVRQLLAAIPEEFPRPILVRLQLEGGRYDRLVKQMTRATSMPVVVAEPGQVAVPGQVHFLVPGVGLVASGAEWKFDAAAPEASAALLPANDSAVLFLSGADVARVAAAGMGEWIGGLVLGQTPDDSCYDPAAANAAIGGGAAHGTPAELAARLVERWLPSALPPSDDASGMLQP